jgi:hypothetical protein
MFVRHYTVQNVRWSTVQIWVIWVEMPNYCPFQALIVWAGPDPGWALQEKPAAALAALGFTCALG